MKKTRVAVLLCGILGATAPSGAYDTISLGATASFKKTVSRPGGAAVLKNGDWVVSDAAAGTLRVFSPDGKPKAGWGAKGKGAGQFQEPRGLAVDADGLLYAADAGHHRVSVLSPDGKHALNIGARGAGAGELNAPWGVAVAHDGVVYVADTGNNRVQVFSRDGIYLLGFGGPGETDGLFKSPTAVAVSPTGRVFVMDQKRVQMFSTAGKFLGVLKRPLAEPKDKEAPAPQGLAADAFGFAYVSGAHQKVEEYGPDGAYLASFGTYGSGAGQFKELSSLAAAPSGAILAVDKSLERVQSFKPVSADRNAPRAAGPSLRFTVKARDKTPFVVDDLAFLDGAAVGVNAKLHQVWIAGKKGAEKAKVLGARGKSPEQLNGPAGVAAKDGKIFIADAGNARVLVWDGAGKSALAGAIGSGGRREGQFKAPKAVAVDAQGRVAVADPDAPRVQLFSADGIFLQTLGAAGKEKGQYLQPVDVAPLPKGLVVLDAGRKTVLFFNEKGKGTGEADAAFLQPVGLATDPRGLLSFVYVLDAGTGQVKVLSAGKVAATFGSSSLFSGPKALALDDDGRLWVADAAGLKSFDVRLTPLAPEDFKAVAGEGRVKLSWSPDPEKLGSSFRLYRSTASGGSGAPFRVFAATETAFVDDEIVPGLTYSYALAAVADCVGETCAGAAGDGGALEGARAEAEVATTRPANLPPVELAGIDLSNIFSAQYKYYEKNPVGRVTIKNNTEKSFQKIRVGFILQNYMDFVTEKVIDRFEPGARETLELKATFNNKILSVTEDTPIQAQMTITYYDNGEEKVFKRTEPVTLYARNAMSWDDLRRLATFVTAKDPALLEFARAVVRDFNGEISATPVNPAVAKASFLFEALGAHGITYLKDPNNPFNKDAADDKTVDYVEYPRETLKRKTGDCDDLTALYAAMLEAVGVPAALIDVPGHVFPAFQVDETAPFQPGLPDGQVLRRDGSLWVPVEVTRAGQPFLAAWEAGAKNVQNAAEDKMRVAEFRDAAAVFPPATLPEEPGVPAPKKEEIAAKFPEGLKPLEARRLEILTRRYEARVQENPKDEEALLQLGIAAAEHGRWDESAASFDKLLAVNPKNASALNNRANLHWLKGDAAKAAELYGRAAQSDPADDGVQLNLARAAHKAGDKETAKKAFDKALSLKPALKKDVGAFDEFVK